MFTDPPPPVADSVHALSESHDPIVISSTAHDDAVDRHSIRAVDILRDVALSPVYTKFPSVHAVSN